MQYLHRPEPTRRDIELTADCIINQNFDYSADGSEEPAVAASGPSSMWGLGPWLRPLANAYHTIYTQQEGRELIGMRDFYGLLKLLVRKVESAGGTLTRELLTYGVCRNFNGSRSVLGAALESFHQECFNRSFAYVGPLHKPPPLPGFSTLAQDNLKDGLSRHLMVLTHGSAALPLLFGSGLLPERRTSVLIGSKFSEDANELHVVHQINQVKLAMANGTTLVLVDHDNIYEALYDVLNQRFVVTHDERTGARARARRHACAGACAGDAVRT